MPELLQFVLAWRSIDEAVAFTARGREWIQRVSFEQVGETTHAVVLRRVLV